MVGRLGLGRVQLSVMSTSKGDLAWRKTPTPPPAPLFLPLPPPRPGVLICLALLVSLGGSVWGGYRFTTSRGLPQCGSRPQSPAAVPAGPRKRKFKPHV
jgi:hypothetical protein